MSLASTPTDYANLCTGTLAVAITTSTATGMTVTADTFVTPAGTGPATWPTGNQVWKISRKTRTNTSVEYVGVESLSQSGTAITTGTVNRYLPANGSSLASQGSGLSFPAGSIVELVWHAWNAEQAAYKDTTNTFTGSGAIRSSSTTTPIIRLNNVTTTQRTNMSAANGDMVYDTDLNQVYKYEAGAWAAQATGTFSNAANGTAGKVDLATAAEVAAGTATDATSGAPNVIPVSIVKTSSTGAANGTVPALNSAVALDVSIGGTGRTSVTTGALLIGAGTSQMTLTGPGTSGQVPTSNGTTIAMANPVPTNVLKSVAVSTDTIASSTSENDVSNTSLTIAANSLVVGMTYDVLLVGTGKINSGGTITGKLKIGSVTMVNQSIFTGTDTVGTWRILGKITCTAIGASGKIIYTINTDSKAAGAHAFLDQTTTEVTLDTTASNVLKLTATADNSSATYYFRCYTAVYNLFS